MGSSSGEKRAEEAAQAAINSPLLEVSITGAKEVLFAIASGDDLGMLEIQDAARVITESIDPHAKVIFGAIKDEKLKKNDVKITVIAAGFRKKVSALLNQTPWYERVRQLKETEEKPKGARTNINSLFTT
ncbi:MAG: hypothetical protein R3B69_03525 [Candidatus Paceibacterota bacterium]